MNINKHNYEEYLIDFMDGNLSTHETEVVISFLNKNPDIKAEAENLFDFNSVTNEKIELPNKDLLLKRSRNDIEGISKFEQLSIAKLENEISTAEEESLHLLLKNSKDKQQEHKLIQNCKLKAEKIEFKGKSKLKRYSITSNKRILYLISSVAASVALLISFLLINTEENNLYTSAIDYKQVNINIRQVVVKELPKNRDILIKKRKTIIIDSSNSIIANETREIEKIVLLNNKKILQIENKTKTNVPTENQISAIAHYVPDIEKQEAKVDDYIKRTLQKLGVEQKEEKPLVAKAGKKIGQFFKKVIKKNFQLKKVDMEDGRKLYAVRAGSLEFYTNVKGKKNKSKSKEGNQEEIINKDN